ncbi:MAG TPA: MerR family transcriptional regulator [Candidatus Saccharimonadales bacterium]|nr:MerR family transcriptional regulator [Candidatus Saccharimonadales bacterium]
MQSGIRPNAGESELLKVGDLARRSGKSVRALHLYEELGLLQPAARTTGGFRLFDAESLRRIHWIGLLQEMGLSLPQIRELLESWWSEERGPAAMQGVREMFQSKLEEARRQARRYQVLARELESSLQYIETCRQACRPAAHVETCTRCPHDHGMSEEPVLVAGLHMLNPPGRGRGERASIEFRDDHGAPAPPDEEISE